MPKSTEEIVAELLDELENPPHKRQALMQDPYQMQGTMRGGAPIPNRDMSFNPQMYDTMNPAPDPGIRLDQLRRGEEIDDSKTREQYMRDRRERTRNFKEQKTPVINPDQQDDSAVRFGRMNEFGEMADPDMADMPPPNSPEEPKSLPPMKYYGTPQLDPDELTLRSMQRQNMQEGNTTMQELMDFYTYGGQNT
jgi:hypothetical protein